MSIRVGVRSSLANEATSLNRKSRLLETVTDFFYGGDFEETSHEWDVWGLERCRCLMSFLVQPWSENSVNVR